MTLKKVFSCELGEIFKNTFFKEHIQITTNNTDNKMLTVIRKKNIMGEITIFIQNTFKF